MEKIVLIGAGGHCKVIIDIIKNSYQKEFNIIGITDNDCIGNYVLDVPIIGNDDILPDLHEHGVKNAFICVGSLDNLQIRNKILKKLKKIGFQLPTLIHNRSIVSSYSKIGESCCIMAGAIINPGCIIKSNCIINTGAIVEHDCIIGENTHISPNASIAGNVNIGTGCHIGIGSSIIQGIVIGNNSVVGAGATVIKNVPDNVLVAGVPAKVKKYK